MFPSPLFEWTGTLQGYLSTGSMFGYSLFVIVDENCVHKFVVFLEGGFNVNVTVSCD